MMLEENSLEIAAYLSRWIEAHARRAPLPGAQVSVGLAPGQGYVALSLGQRSAPVAGEMDDPGVNLDEE
jgi:hypothetical protein